MACSSSGRVLAALFLLAAPGCFTGRLMESGRLHESLVNYTSAALEGGELRLDYTVQVSDAHDQPRSNEKRSATLALTEWAARPERPVDGLPIRRVRPGKRSGREVPVALVINPGSASPVGGSPLLTGPVLEVDESNGRHTGFRLCPAVSAPCQGYFHSAAFDRDHLAWWVYPVAPLAMGVDVVLLPVQAVTLPLLLCFSD